jgi:hypothetical protein
VVAIPAVCLRIQWGESSGTVFGLILKQVRSPAGGEKRWKARGWRGTTEEDQDDGEGMSSEEDKYSQHRLKEIPTENSYASRFTSDEADLT